MEDYSQNNPFQDLIEKAKEFEEFGKRMSLDLQNSYKEFLYQQMERESNGEDGYQKYEEKITSQSRLIDSLRDRIEELETDSIIKEQDFKKLRKEFSDFKKEVQATLRNNRNNNQYNQYDEPSNTGLSSEERSLIRKISQSVEKTKTNLLPKIESFESSVSSFLSNQYINDVEGTKSRLTDTHHYIEENLMQALLALDNITCPSEFETARKERREAVKYVQGLIDKAEKAIQSVEQVDKNKDPFSEPLNMNDLSPNERSLIRRILKSTEKTKTDMIPRIESFESSVSSYINSDFGSESKLIESHNYIVEILMQALFTLDDVTCPSELKVAREKRRAAVNYTQGLIDRVDAVKARLSSSYY